METSFDATCSIFGKALTRSVIAWRETITLTDSCSTEIINIMHKNKKTFGIKNSPSDGLLTQQHGFFCFPQK